MKNFLWDDKKAEKDGLKKRSANTRKNYFSVVVH